MAIEITMPRLSDTMEEGTLIKWRVHVGDRVSSGDVLGDVETDKATMELTAYDDGVVAKLEAKEGETLPVGTLILVLAEEGESLEEAVATVSGGGMNAEEAKKQSKGGGSGGSGSATAVAGSAPARRVTPSGSAEGARVKVSPVARRIAEERGLELSTVSGSGPGGRIIKRDVLAAVEGGVKPAASSEVVMDASAVTGDTLEARTIPVSNMRKTIARRLVESKTTIPHFTVTMTVQVGKLLSMRAELNAQLEPRGVKLSVNDFMVRACAIALQRHPTVNSSWTDEGIDQHGGVNIGVAVALPEEKGGGLVVPTLRDAHRMSLRTISTETRRLARKARGQGLTIEEMSGGTFTVSNLGMFGVEHFEAIINPPQAAILAIGAAIEKPVVREGEVAIGWEMTLTLSGDHRVVDGATGAAFLQTLKQLIETPAAMLV